MWRILNEAEEKELQEDIESTIQASYLYLRNFDKEILVGKNSSDKEFLDAIIEETLYYKNNITKLIPEIKVRLKQADRSISPIFFHNYEQEIKKLVAQFDEIIGMCNNRMNNILPDDETMSVCMLTRMCMPGDFAIRPFLSKFHCNNLQEFSTKKMHGRHKAFLEAAQDVLCSESSNIEFVEVQSMFRQYITGLYKADEKSLIEEYERVKDKKDIVNDIPLYLYKKGQR